MHSQGVGKQVGSMKQHETYWEEFRAGVRVVAKPACRERVESRSGPVRTTERRELRLLRRLEAGSARLLSPPLLDIVYRVSHAFLFRRVFYTSGLRTR